MESTAVHIGRGPHRLIETNTYDDEGLVTFGAISETRQLVAKSIQSVTRAVADIVSMTNHEQFRSAVINNLQVGSTADMVATLTATLMDTSRHRHHGIWHGTPTANSSQNAEVMPQTVPRDDDDVIRVSQADAMNSGCRQQIASDVHSGATPVGGSTSATRCPPIDGGRCGAETVADQDAPGQLSPFHQLVDNVHECSNLVRGVCAEAVSGHSSCPGATYTQS